MRHTVLAIDDSKKIVEIIRYFLEQEGFAVKTALDPAEGLRMAQGGGIDVILLDIMMPGMDGYTLYDHLKRDERTRDVPVIMLTAKAIIRHTPKDFFFGLYGFLAKPFTKQQLLRKVQDALRVTKAEEGIETAELEEGQDESAP